jgi:hypothetical protein
LEDFRAKKGEIDARRLGAQDALERIARQVQALAQTGEMIHSLATYCRQVREKLHDFTLAKRQLALEALDIRARWRPGQLPEVKGSIDPLCIDSHTL